MGMRLIGSDEAHWSPHRRALSFKVIYRQRGSYFTMRNMGEITIQRGHRLSQKLMQMIEALRLWKPGRHSGFLS